MNELHCTTCDAIVPAGAVKCPGCGLQLTTSAAPAVYVERARWPLWPIILGALLVSFVIAHELDRQASAKAVAAREAFAADWVAGRLDDAASFEARCGRPILIQSLPVDGNVLHYSSGTAGDYLVTLGAAPRLELEHVRIAKGRAKTQREPVSPWQFYAGAGCRK